MKLGPNSVYVHVYKSVCTITEDHSSLQRFISEGFVADATGSFVDVEIAADSMAGAVQVIQSRLPQSGPRKRVQQVTYTHTPHLL